MTRAFAWQRPSSRDEAVNAKIQDYHRENERRYIFDCNRPQFFYEDAFSVYIELLHGFCKAVFPSKAEGDQQPADRKHINRRKPVHEIEIGISEKNPEVLERSERKSGRYPELKIADPKTRALSSCPIPSHPL